MEGIRTFFIHLFNVIYRLLYEYSKYVLVAIVVIVSAQVFARNVLGSSIVWSQEVSLLLVVWMTFLACAIGAEKNLHISVELFYSLFPKPLQVFCDRMNDVIVIAIGAFFAYYGWKLTVSTMSSTLAATKWPAGVLYLMIPVGGACMCFFKLLDFLGWKKYKKTDYDEEGEE